MTKGKYKIALMKKLSDAIFLFLKKHTYSDLSDKQFTMDRYMELVVHGRLKSLRKLQIPYPKSVLIAAYEDIQRQYMELTDNNKMSLKSKRRERRNRYVKRYNLLIVCGTVLAVQPNNKDVIEFLNNNDIKGENLIKKIQSECNVLKSRIAEIDAIDENEKTQEKKNGKNSEKLSEAYYLRTFIRLNMNGCRASRDMSVLEFIEAINEINEISKQREKDAEAIKNKKK